MRMPIDVIFVDKQGSVVKVLPALPPWKMLLPVPKAVHAIEMDAGQVARLAIAEGDRLSLEGVF